MSAPPLPFTAAEMLRLASSGVAKVDLLGERGTTLCSMDEIAAMAALIVVSNALPGPPQRIAYAELIETSRKGLTT